MIICFFLISGKTFTFKHVCNIVENERLVTFSYVAMSDGRIKDGKFYVDNIAGWSKFDSNEKVESE